MILQTLSTYEYNEISMGEPKFNRPKDVFEWWVSFLYKFDTLYNTRRSHGTNIAYSSKHQSYLDLSFLDSLHVDYHPSIKDTISCMDEDTRYNAILFSFGLLVIKRQKGKFVLAIFVNDSKLDGEILGSCDKLLSLIYHKKDFVKIDENIDELVQLILQS